MTNAQYQRIYKDWGAIINMACENSIIPPALVFGLMCNEAGLWLSKGEWPVPSRFEQHVFDRLKQVQAGTRKDYKGITLPDISHLTDPALKNLATSHGATQIMGWYSVSYLPYKIGDIRGNKETCMRATVLLLKLTKDELPPNQDSAIEYIKDGDYESVFRIWNTGKHDGITYHIDYVANGIKAMEYIQ